MARFAKKIAEVKIRFWLATVDVNWLGNAGNALTPSASESAETDARVDQHHELPTGCNIEIIQAFALNSETDSRGRHEF